jgi:hypothetical protein
LYYFVDGFNKIEANSALIKLGERASRTTCCKRKRRSTNPEFLIDSCDPLREKRNEKLIKIKDLKLTQTSKHRSP